MSSEITEFTFGLWRLAEGDDSFIPINRHTRERPTVAEWLVRLNVNGFSEEEIEISRREVAMLLERRDTLAVELLNHLATNFPKSMSYDLVVDLLCSEQVLTTCDVVPLARFIHWKIDSGEAIYTPIFRPCVLASRRMASLTKMAMLYDREWMLQSLPLIFDGSIAENRTRAILTLQGLSSAVRQEFTAALEKQRTDIGTEKVDGLLALVQQLLSLSEETKR